MSVTLEGLSGSQNGQPGLRILGACSIFAKRLSKSDDDDKVASATDSSDFVIF